jgi:hypothetical protein
MGIPGFAARGITIAVTINSFKTILIARELLK